MEKFYLDVKGSDTQKIKVYTSYNLGGSNWFSGGTTQRGYYLHVQPVERVQPEMGGGILESMCPTDGYRMLLKSVSRKSQRAEKEADALAQAHYADLVHRVLAEQRFELTEPLPH